MNRLTRIAWMLVVGFAIVYLALQNIEQRRRISALEQRIGQSAASARLTPTSYPGGETREQYIDRQVRGILQDRADSEEIRRRVEAAARR